MEDRIQTNAAGTRSFTWLLAAFGSVGVGLALLGTYGVIAYSVSQRTREIGIRMALGAHRADIMRMVSAQGVRIAVTGLLIGLALSLVLMRFLATMLFKVEPRDPVVFAAVTVLVGLAAVGGSYVPARRAATSEVVAALRQE